MTTRLVSGARQPLEQAVHLDVVGLEAALVALARIARHVGEPCELPLQRHFPSGTRNSKGMRRIACNRSRQSPTESLKLVMRIRSCISRSRSMSAVMICSRSGKALGLGQQVGVLVDQRMAVPGEVGGRFARPGAEYR